MRREAHGGGFSRAYAVPVAQNEEGVGMEPWDVVRADIPDAATFVRIGPDTKTCMHEEHLGPGRKDVVLMYFLGPNPYGPRGGTSGKVVDAKCIAQSSVPTAKYWDAYVDIYRKGVKAVVASGKTLVVRGAHDVAIWRAARIVSYKRAHIDDVALLVQELPRIPLAFRPAVAATLGEELMAEATAKLAERNPLLRRAARSRREVADLSR